MSGTSAGMPRVPQLLIDIGNTRLKWAWCDEARSGAVLHETPLPTPWPHGGAVAHGELATLVAQWASLRAAGAQPQVWVSNVAGPAIAASLQATLDTVFGPGIGVNWVRSGPRFGGLVNGYREPTQLGVDRWIGSIGARCYRPEGALLIVTAGTATTLDVVSAQDRFEGGLILPGLDLMLGALARNTAQLPSLDVSDAGLATPWADNTRDAIAAGCLAAQAGAVERTWRALRERGPVRCLLSGGARHVLANALSMPFEMHDNLVLLGLHVMASQSPAGTAG
ncbi:type III pantothenate kinase [Cupriavidus basilensis]|uniref:type III pantothenate kinase n=1 Tax=Cupriavidus basilensis TaxID=68895 RepID=UPI00284E235E|nr:type III pantothenate kinase [Cupriavidus basilensis]MDR3382998.1 type III pantothenate kinase [Cupriavidus basilensis]